MTLNFKTFVLSLTLFLALGSRIFSHSNCPVSVSGSFSVCPDFSTTLTAFGANSYTWTSSSLTAAVVSNTVSVSAGTYMVKGNVNSCVDSTIVTVTLNPPLNIPLSVSSNTACKESNYPAFSTPVTMTASGAASYYWIASTSQPNFPILGPSVITRPATTTCYTVFGSTSACSGSAATCVTIIPQYTLTVKPAQSKICTGDQIFLVVNQIGGFGVVQNSAFTFNWSGPPGTLDTPYTYSVHASPVSNAVYTVELTDYRSCISAPYTVSVNVEECTSAQDLAKGDRLTIFPNPCTTFINVQVSPGSKVVLFNGVGQKVEAECNMNNDLMWINTEKLLPGIYYLHAQSPEGKIRLTRIIKE